MARKRTGRAPGRPRKPNPPQSPQVNPPAVPGGIAISSDEPAAVDDLAAMIAEEEPPPDDLPPAAPAAAAPPGGQDVPLEVILPGVICSLGNVACERFKVPPITEAEGEMIGAPLAKLCELYGVGPKDAKGVAWYHFALGCAAVIVPRMQSFKLRKLEPKKPEPEPVTVEKADEPPADYDPSRATG